MASSDPDPDRDGRPASNALYVVHARPTSPDVEDEFNRWYSDEHVPHAVALDGWLSGRRYRAWGPPTGTVATDRFAPYLCVYEWHVDRPSDGLEALRVGLADGRIGVSDTLDVTSLAGQVYVPMGERVDRTR